MKLEPNEVPVNDKGEQANLVLSISGTLYPFWVRAGQFSGLAEGERYLLIFAVKGATPETPDQLYFMESDKTLDTVLWETVAELLRDKFPRVEVVDVLENNAQRSVFKYSLIPESQLVVVNHPTTGEVSYTTSQSIN